MKQIEVTFNDDTTQADIDGTAELLRVVFENFQITAVIIVKDEPFEPREIVHYTKAGKLEVLGVIPPRVSE
jgi:hypothetical protein